MRKMSTIQKVNWYKNLNNCGHAENLGALFLTKVVTKFHNNTESILLRYLWEERTDIVLQVSLWEYYDLY